jgi:uncharacterized protein (TIGR02145 family)
MKSSASDTPSWDGTNNGGFSALPGGLRGYFDGSFGAGGNYGVWWSASPDGASYALNRYLYSDYDFVLELSSSARNGFSVRCVDATSSAAVPTVSTSAASDVAETGATLNGSIDSDGGDAITATGFRWGQAANLSDAQDLAGSATSGAFTGSLASLAAGTTYYFTAFATNGEGTSHGDTLSFTTSAAASAGFTTCGDDMTYEGYDYATVEIGSQCWFAENLRTTSYNDASTIPNGLSITEWGYTPYGAVTVYEVGGSNEAANLADYGRLYNWFAVNTGLLCPTGWHVPSDGEWKTLEMALGMTLSEADNTGFRGTDQGTQLKSSQLDSPSWNGSNTSGFSALPGGARSYYNGYFNYEGDGGSWWSSSPHDDAFNAWSRDLYSSNGSVYRDRYDRNYGMSVRCVRD